MSQPVIEISDLSFSYDGRNVLEHVNVTIYKQEVVSIVGPNGGGKTTLLKLMLGLLSPNQGTVRIFGGSPVDVRSRIGYMPQHAHLDPQFPVTVMDVVLMGRLGHAPIFGPYAKRDKAAAQESLERLHAWDLRKRLFSELSGGQRQRAMIARALVSEPELLLLDEPTAGLDLEVEAEVLSILKQLSTDLTVVLVSHDLGFVSTLVNKVVCVKGKVAVHPTSDVTGELIRDMYGATVKMVRHDLGDTGEVFKCLGS